MEYFPGARVAGSRSANTRFSCSVVYGLFPSDERYGVSTEAKEQEPYIPVRYNVPMYIMAKFRSKRILLELFYQAVSG